MPPDAASENREPGLAVNLTFIVPGLGYLYVGERMKALALLLVWIALFCWGASLLILAEGSLRSRRGTTS